MPFASPASSRAAPGPAGRPAALVATLTELADATDDLTIAVERHDLAGLLDANDRAEALTARADGLANALDDADRARLDPRQVLALRERLDTAARRNAYLIERAWALDAATMRLLAGLGRPAPETPAATYSTPAPAAYLDRQA